MQKRVFFNIVLVLLLGVCISGILSARVVERNFRSNIEQRLMSESRLLSELAADRLMKDTGKAADSINELKSMMEARITVIDLQGNVLADTERNYSDMDNHSGRPELSDALKGNIGKSIRYSDTLEVDLMYVAHPIYKEGSVAGAVRLSKPLYEINALLSKLYVNICIAVVAGILAASLLGYGISVSVTRPVKEITYTASRIAEGKFDRQINISGKDEIGVLADSINNMAAKLNDMIMKLQDKNIRLESIMSSMVNGIIAIDNSERVLFINPAAERLMKITDKEIVGKHMLQVIRSNSIDNYLKRILKDKEFFDTEITIEDPVERIFKLYANPINKNDTVDMQGIIITIQDITELRKLERMRTEFVANVSHELKTPLTSIKGFAETLKSGDIVDSKDAVRFLDIIEDEADRLYRLINDILALSELEHKKTKMIIEEINVGKMIEEVLSMLKSQSESKNIQLSMNIEKGLKSIKGDADKVKQMLINLVDNAIKYTPEKGQVLVEAYNLEEESSGDKIIIKVKDNGIGIPKQHIPRLFERFYRVDKARSRKVGGTGLGLAIVKHIAILLNGEIEVESEVGRGTEFRIIIPASR